MEQPSTISIHGPRVGADHDGRDRNLCQGYFNPRPPCGGRLSWAVHTPVALLFQSTAPVWGPTSLSSCVNAGLPISIHGPRVGADQKLIACSARLLHFNPRPPCGGRLGSRRRNAGESGFQSTAPVWGPTRPAGAAAGLLSDFNPRPPCGGRPMEISDRIRLIHFNPRPPCGGRPRTASPSLGSA